MAELPPSPLLKIMGWVYDGDNRLVGIVVDTGQTWRYRRFAPEDYMTLPTPLARLARVVRPYLEGPDQS